MAYQLPDLPYAFDALEPHIDARTMEIHHGKHHNAYVTNLNKALEGQDTLAAKNIEDLISDLSAVPEGIRTAVRNNAGGHANHSLFWQILGPNAGGQPSGKLAEAIETECGGFAVLKDAVEKAGVTRFGSGWAWLCVKEGKLCVCSTPNQDSPLMHGVVDCPGTLERHQLGRGRQTIRSGVIEQCPAGSAERCSSGNSLLHGWGDPCYTVCSEM